MNRLYLEADNPNLAQPLAYEAQLICTLSKYHCLIHELYLPNHHSSQQHAIYGTSCLFAFLIRTTCHLSNPRSISLILFPSRRSFSHSSFFYCWGGGGLNIGSMNGCLTAILPVYQKLRAISGNCCFFFS